MTTIHVMTPADWARVRDLRLTALADTPDAFGSTLEREQSFVEAQWRQRLSSAVTFIAQLDDQDAGMVTGLASEEPGTAFLVGMWVSPAHRGAGIGRQLIAQLISWAQAEGFGRISLEVGDSNASARRLYKSLGFEPTGRTGTLPPPRTHLLEHECELVL